jgi:hypothetical protein
MKIILILALLTFTSCSTTVKEDPEAEDSQAELLKKHRHDKN